MPHEAWRPVENTTDLFALYPLPPDVEPYVWYHQSMVKTMGFYSIKLVLSQLCRAFSCRRRLRLTEETHHLSVGPENGRHFPASVQNREIYITDLSGKANTTHASQVKGFGYSLTSRVRATQGNIEEGIHKSIHLALLCFS